MRRISLDEKMKHIIDISNAYISGVVGSNNPDYMDICQDAYIDIFTLTRNDPFRVKSYSANYIFENRIKGKIDKNIAKNYSHSEISIEDVEIMTSDDDRIIAGFMLNDILSVFKTLTKREKELIILRFFDGMSPIEIEREKMIERADKDGYIGATRVTQLEYKILRKLRRPPRLKYLIKYIDCSFDQAATIVPKEEQTKEVKTMKNTISRFVIEGCIGDMNCKTIIKKIYDDKKNIYYVVNKCSLGEESSEELYSESDADYAYEYAKDDARDIYDNVTEEYEEYEE